MYNYYLYSNSSLVAQHIKAVNHIYENTDFNGIRGLKFIVQRLKINDSSACETPLKREQNPFCSPNIDVSNFLNLNSQFNHDDFCLAYIFSFRNFEGGTLGLAWVASTSGASGGICEKYKSYTENVHGRQIQTKRSLNTGIITFVNYNSRVPPKGEMIRYVRNLYNILIVTIFFPQFPSLHLVCYSFENDALINKFIN